MPRTARRRARARRQRRRLLFALVLAIAAISAVLVPAGADEAPPPPADPGQPPAAVTGGARWAPIFSDDFDGTSVDSTRWNVADSANYGSGNSEDQCYEARNTTVADGELRLTGARETVTGCGSNPDGGSTYFFTSGLVTTRANYGNLKFKFRQGYTEIRMRAPRGNLYWPAFWLAGAADGSSPSWPAYGEMDVAEIYGAHPDVAESNFHRTGGSIGAGAFNVVTGTIDPGTDINPPNPLVAGGTNDWHTYSLNWTADRLEWFVDGTLVRTYVASTTADVAALGYEHSIIVNLAMGGTGAIDAGYTGGETPGGYDDGNLSADLPGTLEVDYVRVWQPAPPPAAPTVTAPTDGSVVPTPTTDFAGACASEVGPVTVSIVGPTDATLTAPCDADAWSISAPVADGTYSVTASQAPGGSDAGPPAWFTVDTVAPTVSLASPSDGARLVVPVTAFAGGCTDGDGPVTVALTGAAAPTATVPCSGGAWSASLDLDDGAYAASASQTDAAGHTGVSAGAAFTVDSTTPTTTDDAATIGSAWRNTPVTVTLTPADGGAGVASTYFTTDGSTPDQTSPSGTSIALTADGVYTVRYFSVDAFGNAEPVRTAGTPIRIDTGQPVTTDDTASIGSGWKTSPQTVTLTATDPRSGVATTYFTTDGSIPTTASAQGTAVSLATTGSYVVRYFSVDAAGNVEPVRTAGTAIRIDTTPPSPAITFPADGGRYNSSSWSAGCSSSARICGTATDEESGVTNVKVTIRRSSDNRYWSGSSWQTSSTSVTASGTTSWSAPLSTSQLANGVTYAVTVKVADGAGNTSVGLVRSFTYDTSGPSVSSSGLAVTNKNGNVDAGDTFSVTFNEALNPATVSAAGTLTLSRGSRNTSYAISGLTNGLRDTGTTGYLTGSSSTRSVTFAGSSALSNNNRTVIFTVSGPCAGSCSALSTTPRSGSFQFVAATTLRDVAGNAASTSSVSASSQVMF